MEFLLNPADYEVGGTRSVATKSFQVTVRRALLQEMKQRFHFCTENKSLLIFLCQSSLSSSVKAKTSRRFRYVGGVLVCRKVYIV